MSSTPTTLACRQETEVFRLLGGKGSGMSSTQPMVRMYMPV